MNFKGKTIAIAVYMVMTLYVQAQIKHFDPTLDPNVTILPTQPQEEWKSQYMWYPGQLAAFYQQQWDIPGNSLPNVTRLISGMK